jgi:hypothetical protein
MLRQTMGTNNVKVASDISNSYQYGEGELELTVYKKVNPPYTNM